MEGVDYNEEEEPYCHCYLDDTSNYARALRVSIDTISKIRYESNYQYINEYTLEC
jgi:hypothetical protein